MEIKKGISQMAEYPNVEINYVMSNDGRMYYVLKEGVLANGCIIATLDPKYAIDESNPSTSVGVFSATGDVLVDFDKKSIKAISDDLVLAVNSKLNTPEVIGVAGREDDPMTSNTVNTSKTVIINKLKEEMGPNGELLFEDPYSEANVYRIDTYNNKLGSDSSFIGKSEKGLFFHTNDAKSTTQIVEIDDFKSDENVVIEDANDTDDNNISSGDLNLDIDSDLLSGFSIPEEDLEKVSVEEEKTEDNNVVSSEEVAEDVEDDAKSPDTDKDVAEKESVTENDNSNDESSDDEINIKKEHSLNIDEEDSKQEEIDETPDNSDNNDLDIEQKDINLNIADDSSDTEEYVSSDEAEESSDNEVLDNAISVINKMIKETNKLKDKINELEEELEEKEKIIKESESKKDELNEILDKANEVLDEID